MTETPTQDRDPPVSAPPPRRAGRRTPPRRGPLHHLGQFCLGCVIAGIVIALALSAVLATGVTAPGWLRDRAEQRVSDRLDDNRLSFGRWSSGSGTAWRRGSRCAMSRCATPAVRRSPIWRGWTSPCRAGALLRGALAPSRVRMAGGRLILRRAADGTLSVAFGAEAGGGRHPPDDRPFPEQLGAMLSRPMLAGLEAVTVEQLSLRYEDARSGRAWSADGGQAALERSGDRIELRGNVIVLGDRDYASSLEVNYSGPLDGSGADFGVRFEDVPAREIAAQSPALAWLGALEAPISGAVRAELDGAARLGPLDATLQIGAGALRPNPATVPIPFRSARTYFTYRPDNREIAFSEISVESDWGTARAEGRARLVGMEAGWPQGLEAQVELGEIAANPAGLYPEPVVFDGAAAELRLDLDPFALRIGAVRLRDGDRILHLSGGARARPDGWSVDLAGRLARLGARTPPRALAAQAQAQDAGLARRERAERGSARHPDRDARAARRRAGRDPRLRFRRFLHRLCARRAADRGGLGPCLDPRQPPDGACRGGPCHRGAGRARGHLRHRFHHPRHPHQARPRRGASARAGARSPRRCRCSTRRPSGFCKRRGGR